MKRLYAAGLLICLGAAAGVGLLAVKRARAESTEADSRRTALARGPRVLIAKVVLAGGDRDVTLQGEVKPWVSATLYAKVSGYVREIRVDKGDRVTKGQLLATVESPEIDQQVTAAEADLAVKDANYKRAAALIQSAVVSRQELETAQATLKVAQAALAQARAQQSYATLRAPFDSVVTARYVDPGALLSAATGATQSAQPVLDVADMTRLRLYVFLGQDEAAVVREGDAATVTVDQRPDVAIQARVDRLSRTLDPRTRTMLSEVDVDNSDGLLYPGEFVHVRIKLKGAATPRVPAEALISRGAKLYVAVVEHDIARIREVETGLDDGRTVQVVKGLQGGEWVALNATAELGDETVVDPVQLGEPKR